MGENESTDKIFAQDRTFWNNYLKGRPTAPDSFFERIYNYHGQHGQHGGRFGTAHDVGAGNGPYSEKLRARFEHVVVSDVVKENVQLAEARLGKDGFSYRVGKVEDAVADFTDGSVDMVFATNVLHFADDQHAAMEAVARQLAPGGTFACAGFGPALFDDDRVQDVWQRISLQGGRVLLRNGDRPRGETIRAMERSMDDYNVAPLDERWFLPGAQRVHLNMDRGGLTGILPPEVHDEATEPVHLGTHDVVTRANDAGWRFEMDMALLKEHFGSFPHASEDPEAFTELWKEMEDLVSRGRRLDGCFPAALILATRR